MNDIKDKIHKMSGRTFPNKVIYDYLKKEIKYSNKRGSSMLLISRGTKIKYLQATFS